MAVASQHGYHTYPGLSTAGLLAVGLQAQLRDAEAHAGEAEADQKGVRTAGLQLVRDTVTMFQLTATEVFGSATLAFAQQQVSMLASMQVITCAYRSLAPEYVASYARRPLGLCHQYYGKSTAGDGITSHLLLVNFLAGWWQ